MPVDDGVSTRVRGRDGEAQRGRWRGGRKGREKGAGALLVGQADLEAVKVGALELLLELVEGVLDLVLEAVIIIMVLVLDPVAVAVGLVGMRHGQGGGGADRLRERVGDPRAKGERKPKGEGGAEAWTGFPSNYVV